MKLRPVLIMLAMSVLCKAGCLSAEDLVGKDEILILKEKGMIYVRSHFSTQDDIVSVAGIGQFNGQVNLYGAFLIKKTAPMDIASLRSGNYIHRFGDDATPWNINGTYIGANHGASVGMEITSPGHGKGTGDLGSLWQDTAGKKYYLIRIVDKDKLLFLGENRPEGNIWKFDGSLKGNSLKRAGTGEEINFTAKRGGAQIYPSCRIKKQEYLLDGKTPLKEGAAVSCRWFDIVEEYDIVNIGSVLDDIVSNPGKERDFSAPHLGTVIENSITYRFMPSCATVIYYGAKSLQEFRLGYMGFIQSQQLAQGNYDIHQYYIPKTLPFVQDGINYDFAGIQDFSTRPPSPIVLTPDKNNVTDPGNLPERFIQFLGRKNGDTITREVGYALGYSLLHGITVPSIRAANTSNAITVYTTRKSYPNAINLKMGPIIPAGTQFYCVAYRQYFNPAQAGNATCLYWNRQEEDTVVYVDYHKSVENDKIRLPEELAGRKFEVVEKSGSVVLNTQGTVPAEGISVTVSDGYGYIVLKVR